MASAPSVPRSVRLIGIAAGIPQLMPAQPEGLKFNDLEGVLAEVKMVDWAN